MYSFTANQTYVLNNIQNFQIYITWLSIYMNIHNSQTNLKWLSLYMNIHNSHQPKVVITIHEYGQDIKNKKHIKNKNDKNKHIRRQTDEKPKKTHKTFKVSIAVEVEI